MLLLQLLQCNATPPLRAAYTLYRQTRPDVYCGAAAAAATKRYAPLLTVSGVSCSGTVAPVAHCRCCCCSCFCRASISVVCEQCFRQRHNARVSIFSKKSSPSFTPGRLQRYFISRTMEVAATGPTAPPLLRPEELELLLKVTIPTDPTLPTPLLLHSFPCSPLATLGRLKAKHQYRPLPPPAQMATATAKACTSLCCHGT